MVDWDFSGTGTVSEPPQSEGVSIVKAIKALREAIPGTGLREAKNAVEAVFDAARNEGAVLTKGSVAVQLTPQEKRAAEKAAAYGGIGNYASKVDAIVAAINKVRLSDPEGTVRKSPAGQYAFAVSPGTYLVIETGDAPRYRASNEGEGVDIKRSWTLVKG